jgi:predicted transcriptional regulator of viral defense system
MNFEEFLKFAGNLPVIETEILLAGIDNPLAVKVQISRWQKAGKLIQLRRGIYLLAPSYRKIEVYTPHIAVLLKKPSYISLEKALEFYDLIPEAVPVFTSITTKRQGKFDCEVGSFVYRHINNALFWGYSSVTANKQTAFIAYPEKALLDLIYLNEIDISLEYLEGLRLQNVDKINMDRLFDFAKKFKKPKILRAAEIIKKYIETQLKEEKVL